MCLSCLLFRDTDVTDEELTEVIKELGIQVQGGWTGALMRVHRVSIVGSISSLFCGICLNADDVHSQNCARRFRPQALNVLE